MSSFGYSPLLVLSSVAVLLGAVVPFREDECVFCVRCCSEVGGAFLLPFDDASVILSPLPLPIVSRSTTDDVLSEFK